MHYSSTITIHSQEHTHKTCASSCSYTYTYSVVHHHVVIPTHTVLCIWSTCIPYHSSFLSKTTNHMCSTNSNIWTWSNYETKYLACCITKFSRSLQLLVEVQEQLPRGRKTTENWWYISTYPEAASALNAQHMCQLQNETNTLGGKDREREREGCVAHHSPTNH